MTTAPTTPELANDSQRGSHSLQRLVGRHGLTATLYNADCRDILAELKADAVVSDPPYGMDWDTDHTRFVTGPNGHGGGRKSKQRNIRVAHDDESFDPSPWLE